MWKTLLILVTLGNFLNLNAHATKTQSEFPARPNFQVLKENEIFFFWDGQYLKKQFQTSDQVEISADCNPTKGCEALKVSKSKFPVKPAPHAAMNNPGVQYCKSMGGKALIGFIKDGSEIDICRFPDGSLLKAWSAYFKHYPAQEIRAK